MVSPGAERACVVATFCFEGCLQGPALPVSEVFYYIEVRRLPRELWSLCAFNRALRSSLPLGSRVFGRFSVSLDGRVSSCLLVGAPFCGPSLFVLPVLSGFAGADVFVRACSARASRYGWSVFEWVSRWSVFSHIVVEGVPRFGTRPDSSFVSTVSPRYFSCFDSPFMCPFHVGVLDPYGFDRSLGGWRV